MDTTITATALVAQANPNYHDVLLGGTVVGTVRRREINWSMQRVHVTWYDAYLGDEKLGQHDRRDDAYYAVVQAARAQQGLAPDPYVAAVQDAQGQLVYARETAKVLRASTKRAGRDRWRAGATAGTVARYNDLAAREGAADRAVDELKAQLTTAKKALRAAHKAA